MADTNSGTRKDPAAILAHNVREHVEVVLELLGGQSEVSEAAKTRLLAHIAEEERGNGERLDALIGEMETAPPRDLRLMRDHSAILLDILEGAIPQALGIHLLHHFVEEHNTLIALGREDTEDGVGASGHEGAEMDGGGVTADQQPVFRLTLGSLRGQ